LVLIGRTESDLVESQNLIPAPTTSTIFACSVVDEQAIQNAADKIGNWDVLIMGAGHEPSPGKIVDQKLADF
jgi:NADP-dependent 3-hydroxy acid dehydrogenase YdfG